MEKIEIEGWKGESGIEITKQDNDFLLVEYRKSKSTGEVVESKHTISAINVESLWNIILENIPMGEVYTSKYLARKLIQKHNWSEEEEMTEETMMSALWGGKYRAKYYFSYLYYPLKILENKKYITYSGRGNIMRISQSLNIHDS